MSNCYCPVCLSEYPIKTFRRLACGHCYCVTCIGSIQQTQARPACPECRAPIARDGPQPIYLDLVAAKPLERVVAEGIDRMDGDAKLVSVRTAERKLRQVLQEQQERGEAAAGLLGAIADFQDRIIPLFAKARSQATQLATLNKKLEEMENLRGEADRVTGLLGEVAILRADKLVIQGEVRDVATQRDRERARAETAEAQARRAVAAEGEAQTEVRKLKGYLEHGTEARQVQKNKMQALLREKMALQAQLEELRNELSMREARDGASFVYSDDLEIEDSEVFPSEYTEQTSPHRPSLLASRSAPVLGFEGMPRPGFGSDWHLNRGTKRKEREETPSGYPITLSGGRTTVAVQLGPKHTRRVKAR
ncbi:hypothetical protein DFH06DRAFT_1298940 [Mycena polygramma]|nr:hypothetical protein DFH06DRAFT_1298940 [Mycena polygramma]